VEGIGDSVASVPTFQIFSPALVNLLTIKNENYLKRPKTPKFLFMRPVFIFVNPNLFS